MFANIKNVSGTGKKLRIRQKKSGSDRIRKMFFFTPLLTQETVSWTTLWPYQNWFSLILKSFEPAGARVATNQVPPPMELGKGNDSGSQSVVPWKLFPLVCVQASPIRRVLLFCIWIRCFNSTKRTWRLHAVSNHTIVTKICRHFFKANNHGLTKILITNYGRRRTWFNRYRYRYVIYHRKAHLQTETATQIY